MVTLEKQMNKRECDNSIKNSEWFKEGRLGALALPVSLTQE